MSILLSRRRSLPFLIPAALVVLSAACSGTPAPDPAPAIPAPAPTLVLTPAPDSSPAATAEPAPTTAEALPTPTASPTVAPPTTTATATAAPDKPPGRRYIACGCGCCGGVAPDRSICVDRAKGESLDAIIARDKASRRSPSCPRAGCSIGIEYIECD